MGRPEISTSPVKRFPQSQARRTSGIQRGWVTSGLVISGLVLVVVFPQLRFRFFNRTDSGHQQCSVYGQYPRPSDPFQFLPCTPKTVPPSLDDGNAKKSWASLFDPNPDHWSWGQPSKEVVSLEEDRYSGRGIFLCGYLDVPLDYTNKSDSRIARLAVTKFQVSGLALAAHKHTSAGKKSERTIIIEPGGPGGSGTSYAWRAENITERLSGGKFDVLGWDPRGVNISLPAVACFPHDVERDHWTLLTTQHRAVVASPKAQVEIADAMNAAVMRACWERLGDLGRFLSTAFVARDLDQIREALGEDEVTGNFVSYGTGIAQTYASMFPDRVGRMILDGTEYIRDHRLRGGFGWTALDNATDAWRDGFLGECVNAGPDYCALATPKDGKKVTLAELESRMKALFNSLAKRPIPAYISANGPTLVTYSAVVDSVYGAMYNAQSWPTLAKTLYELESGNATLAASLLEKSLWYFDPEQPCPTSPEPPQSDELGNLVVCGDSYDATEPDDLDWWLSLWGNMTAKNWIAANSRFYGVLPCRHFNKYWRPAEVYRGDLNHTLKHPVLLIAETYDPATPLRNGRRLLDEMGSNARLIVHHGYGHSSRDTSTCTDALARGLILHGELPEKPETNCYAREKPYLYGVRNNGLGTLVKSLQAEEDAKNWREHLKELSLFNPRLLPGK